MSETIELLDGQRFHEEANMIYRLPVSEFKKAQMLNKGTGAIETHIDFKDETFIKSIVEFIRHHQEKQVPRLKQLRRYKLADNNIKYRPAKSDNRANNKIASDFANFIVLFKRGVLLGNPVAYNGDDAITEKVNDFASKVNEDYLNQLLADDMFCYGRAYELISRDGNGDETINKLDVTETFVVYDTSVNRNSICGVRYYPIKFNNKMTTIVELYANDGFLYVYKCKDDDLNNLKLEDAPQQTYFDAVQINEWINNEDRTGDFESVMDQIDAYDLSQSEMANFQQDMSEALLVIEGNPDTFKKADGSLDTEGMDYSQKNRILVMGDRKIYPDGQQGSDAKAYYLVKEYDTDGVEAYNERLVADMLRFTSLIDFTDENMGGNQSGVGFRFKGWGSDNDIKNKERMVKKALMRRLRLLTHSWSIKDNLRNPKGFVNQLKSLFKSDSKLQDDLYDRVNDIEILFTPNVPQSDEEVMKVITGMNAVISSQTIFEMASRLTGVSAEEEQKRYDKENPPIMPMFDKEETGEDKENPEVVESGREVDGA